MFIALVLMGNLNNSSICCRDTTAGHRKARSFLEHIVNNSLANMIKESVREHVLLDLIFTDKEERVRDAKSGGSLAATR